MDYALDEHQGNLLKDLYHRCGVVVAYLFGSLARKESGPLSDVDIAVLFSRELSEDERFERRLRMIGKMCGIFRSPEIDLVILNDVPLSLQFEVIKGGRILYCADESARVDFEVKAISLWLDRKYYDDRYSRILLEQIAKDGLR